ncbi:MAG: sodium-dependent transporter [Proteobacteria bacterium]|nr:sodium-dependent transporter [Pseudomonadota bacterium]
MSAADGPDGGSAAAPSRQREHWGTRLGFVLAAAGSAVGLGNIWKFPYVTGENGGGAFLIIYLAIIGTLGISILLAELVIGRTAQKNPVGAFRQLGGTRWRVAGWMCVLGAFAILSFYTVIAGWTIAFAVKTASGRLTAPGADTEAIFESFVSDPVWPLLYAAIFMALTVAVVIGGIRRGIERVSLVLMPLLFLILIALVVRAVTLPGAMEGLLFFLAPDFSKVTGGTITAALGQAFFSLSIGMGAMITYGSYLERKAHIAGSAASVVGLDTLVAILAGLIVFPAVFAVGLRPEGGPGLVFVTLPAVFAAMPASAVFGTLFFLLLTIAALTSSISILEPAVAYFVDEHNLKRSRVTILCGVIAFALGIPSSFSLGIWSDYTLFGKGFLDIMDFLTANIMLPAGGFLIALFVGWVMGPRAIEALAPNTALGLWLARLWLYGLRFIAPAAIAWVLISGLI